MDDAYCGFAFVFFALPLAQNASPLIIGRVRERTTVRIATPSKRDRMNRDQIISGKKSGESSIGFRSHRFELAAIFILVVSIYAAYHQATGFGFIYIDDDLYVTDNPYVQAGLTAKGVSWALTSLKGSMWIPLTWISLMIDYELYGLNPGGYHLTNLLFHMAGTVLLFLFFSRFVGLPRHGLVIAFVFAVHPLRVESVVWITERKDVLMGFFWMAALLAYGRYVRSPNVKRYLAVLVLFIFGLMSKGMVVTFPFVLLLLDIWPFNRLRLPRRFANLSEDTEHDETNKTGALKLVLEKIPFFACTFSATLFGFFALRLQEKTIEDIIPLKIRIANAGVSYILYIKKMLVPNDLSVFYPLHVENYSFGNAAGAFLLILIATIFCVLAFRKHRYLAVGWFWFLGTLVPVIGIRQLGHQAMADRFIYIPHIGITIMIVVGAGKLLSGMRRSNVVIATISVVFACALVYATYIETGYWKNNETLFRHSLKNTADNFVAHNCLGLALLNKGDYDGAVRHLLASLRIKENFGRTRVNLGLAYLGKGDSEKASDCFERVIASNPNQTEAFVNLGNMFLAQGKTDEAIDMYAEAIEKNPKLSMAYTGMGLALLRKGRLDEAIGNLQKSWTLYPKNNEVKRNLIIAINFRKKITEAARKIREFLMKNKEKSLTSEEYETLTSLKKKLDDNIYSLKKGLSTQKGFHEEEFDIRNMPEVYEVIENHTQKGKAGETELIE